MQIRNDLQVMESAANELYKLLPLNDEVIIKDSEYDIFVTENDSLSILNLQLHKIEDQLQDALIKALRSRETQNVPNVQTADRISLSSGAGLSLAMDVQETEPEEDDAQQEFVNFYEQNLASNNQGKF